MSAFDHRLVVAAGLELQTVDRRHDELLRDLERPDLNMHSPTRRMRSEPGWLDSVDDAGNLTCFTTDERAEIIFSLARPISEVQAALHHGRAAFRESASRAVEEKLPDCLLDELLRAVLAHLLAWLDQQKQLSVKS